MQEPTEALFQPSAGTESIAAFTLFNALPIMQGPQPISPLMLNIIQ